jgi:hypothetical protein
MSDWAPQKDDRVRFRVPPPHGVFRVLTVNKKAKVAELRQNRHPPVADVPFRNIRPIYQSDDA